MVFVHMHSFFFARNFCCKLFRNLFVLQSYNNLNSDSTTALLLHIIYDAKSIQYESSAFFKIRILSILAFHQQKNSTLRAENLLNLFRLCLYKMQKKIHISDFLAIYLIKKIFISPPHVLFNNLSLFFIFSEWIFYYSKV